MLKCWLAMVVYWNMEEQRFLWFYGWKMSQDGTEPPPIRCSKDPIRPEPVSRKRDDDSQLTNNHQLETPMTHGNFLELSGPFGHVWRFCRRRGQNVLLQHIQLKLVLRVVPDSFDGKFSEPIQDHSPMNLLFIWLSWQSHLSDRLVSKSDVVVLYIYVYIYMLND